MQMLHLMNFMCPQYCSLGIVEFWQPFPLFDSFTSRPNYSFVIWETVLADARKNKSKRELTKIANV